MGTKRNKIVAYIESLPVGERLSVRAIAKIQDVSEGTAYRAIKDAEDAGLVSTIYRVGTIRIEKKMQERIENLTYAEVLKITEGELIGGSKGIDKSLKQFVIGDMNDDDLKRYLAKGALVIVGNRENIQHKALENNSALLLTGGRHPEQEIIDLADRKNLPLIVTTFDSFTVATRINKAMTDQLIKKEILLMDDIYNDMSKTEYLTIGDTVADYYKLNNESKHSRFPVINKSGRLVGIVTAKDTVGKTDTTSIERVMTKDVISVKKQTSVASVAHSMIWDGLEIMPVVEDDLTMRGIVSRQDVMKAMQSAQRQPQMGETIDDQINEMIEMSTGPSPNPFDETQRKYKFTVTPTMLDNVGTLSIGVLTQVISEVSLKELAAQNKRDTMIEQVNLNYFKLIQIGSEIQLTSRIFEFGRRSARMDIEVYVENVMMAKAFVVLQIVEQV